MMHVSRCEVSADAATDQVAELFGPGQADQMLRQAVQLCWMALPKERRNADELERQMHRLIDRALKDFREDSKAFGSAKQTAKSHAGKKRG
jgi:hypothetical protein